MLTSARPARASSGTVPSRACEDASRLVICTPSAVLELSEPA